MKQSVPFVRDQTASRPAGEMSAGQDRQADGWVTWLAVRVNKGWVVASGVRIDVVAMRGRTQGRMSRLQNVQIEAERSAGLLAQDAPQQGPGRLCDGRRGRRGRRRRRRRRRRVARDGRRGRRTHRRRVAETAVGQQAASSAAAVGCIHCKSQIKVIFIIQSSHFIFKMQSLHMQNSTISLHI